MRMQLNDLSARVCEYATTRLLPKAQGWLAKGAIGGFMPLVPGNLEKLARMTGTLDESGAVDVDQMKLIVTSGFKAAGHLDLLGGAIGFDPSDAEDLFRFLGV